MSNRLSNPSAPQGMCLQEELPKENEIVDLFLYILAFRFHMFAQRFWQVLDYILFKVQFSISIEVYPEKWLQEPCLIFS